MSIVGLINKDVVSDNEAKEGMVSLRILYLNIFLAFTFNLCIAGIPVIIGFPIHNIATYVLIASLFAFTYKAKTRTALITFILFTYAWILAMIPVFGWSAGFQNYFIIILMLCFLASHGKLAFKLGLSGLILAIRIATIFILSGTQPLIPIGAVQGKFIQVVNITFVFMPIVHLSYVFSHQKNEADSKLMQYNDRLVKEAHTDQLTGLYNRRRASEFLEDIRTQASLGSVSIAIGDIDFFKKVNDTYGHDAGDEVLKSVADTMIDVCGKRAIIARWGGEEFLLVFAGMNGDEALTIIESLRQTIQEKEIKVKDQTLRVTMTFGLTEYDFAGDLDATIKEADNNLYRGKESGRNRVVY